MFTSLFWLSGSLKLIDFPGAVEEMKFFHLPFPVATAALMVFVLIVPSVLIVADWLPCTGVMMLVLFTLATIPIAHDFWHMQGMQAVAEQRVVLEHISLVGGLLMITFARRTR
ncbi:hypothetical protein GCM10027093_08570 [Paraburkholderia jirisanensis]